ncbi:hypothetical protein H5410_005081 [Solanum commersonii]|uniref:Uncharacterized protein n=1 Tax=Solanum commersonii TaxID=4109 RepID=A0A9J6A742_SOLCO|nr:hypothetical protein H5410_005081 [Solanum commersonii]
MLFECGCVIFHAHRGVASSTCQSIMYHHVILTLYVVCMIQHIVDLSMLGAFGYVLPKNLFVNLCFLPLCQLCTLWFFVFLHFVRILDFPSYFDGNQQEDAHESLEYFLNQLESCCINLETKDNIVNEAFGGHLVSKVD